MRSKGPFPTPQACKMNPFVIIITVFMVWMIIDEFERIGMRNGDARVDLTRGKRELDQQLYKLSLLFLLDTLFLLCNRQYLP